MVGTLAFLQLAGLIVPFVLVLPLVADGWLVDAAGRAPQVRIAALLLFANGAVTVGISIALYSVFGVAGRAWHLWLLATSVAWLAVQSVDSALMLGMLSLSQQYAGGSAPNGAALEAAGAALGAARS